MNTCKHPDGCERPVKAYGWCRAHADRIRKTGAPGPAKIASRNPADRPCRVIDCGHPVTEHGGFGYCSKHYQRWCKHGSPLVVGKGGASLPGPANPNWSGTEATYAATHLRLRSQRGAAKRHACVDCGKAAAHWSYNNADPDERFDPECGRYSPNTSAYDPRCVPCHSAFDRAARNAALLTGERP